MRMTSLRPEPRPGGRIKKAAKQAQSVERIEQARRRALEEASRAMDGPDWRPRPPPLARLMAGR